MKSYRIIASFGEKMVPVEYILAIGKDLVLFNPNSKMNDFKIQRPSRIFLCDIDTDKLIALDEVTGDFELFNSKGDSIGTSETFSSDIEFYLSDIENNFDEIKIVNEFN